MPLQLLAFHSVFAPTGRGGVGSMVFLSIIIIFFSFPKISNFEEFWHFSTRQKLVIIAFGLVFGLVLHIISPHLTHTYTPFHAHTSHTHSWPDVSLAASSSRCLPRPTCPAVLCSQLLFAECWQGTVSPFTLEIWSHL